MATKKFNAQIRDPKTGEVFSVIGEIKPRKPGDVSRNTGKPYLADIFFTPVSGQLSSKKIHYHFILEDPPNGGRLVRRDEYGNDIDGANGIPCSLEDIRVS